jgi:glycerol-3-phosphate dehydrogenase
VVRDLTRLADATFDLLVVGGGILGLAAAYDAARRGLSVALVERDDLGGGSSFNHLKTLHGGLRSLQTGDLGTFRQAIRERRTLARIAPHHVTPITFLLPTRRSLMRGRLALRAAFLVDGLLSADRNAGLPPAWHLPAGRVLDAAEARGRTAGHWDESANGAACWHDYQAPRTERLTLAVARAAHEAGAALANYVEAISPLLAGGRVVGLRLRDGLTGREFDVHGRALLNAAGSGAPALRRALGDHADLPLQKAMNLVTARPWSGPALGASHEGGTLFLVGWEGRLVVGTWHDERAAHPASATVTADEVARFLADVDRAFPRLRLREDEITLVHRGIVPGVRRGDGRVAMRSRGELVDHAGHGAANAFSLVAVKYTTGRGVAERAVDRVVAALGRGALRGTTAEVPLPDALGGDPGREIAAARRAFPRLNAAAASHLVLSYGTGWSRVVACAAESGHDGLAAVDAPWPVVRAEVWHAVRHEMAQSLPDVVVRRTRLGVAGHPGHAAAAAVAALLADELGWDATRVGRELEALRAFYAPILRDADPPRGA